MISDMLCQAPVSDTSLVLSKEEKSCSVACFYCSLKKHLLAAGIMYHVFTVFLFVFLCFALQSSFLGSATFSIGDLLRAKDERLTLSLR